MMDESFQTSLFACSLEIVLFSYSSPKRFPWILEVFDLPGYSFFKVIEVVVRAEDNLSRDVVKHLSQVGKVFFKIKSVYSYLIRKTES